MPADHPLIHAQFALSEQSRRLDAWKQKDDLAGGKQAAKIDQRADELLAFVGLIEYAEKLERIVMALDAKLERAKEANWMEGYKAAIRRNGPGQLMATELAHKHLRINQALLRLLEQQGIKVIMPEGDKQAA